MSHIHVWSPDKELEKELKDTLEADYECLGWALPFESVASYRISPAIQSYIAAHVAMKDGATPRIGAVLSGDSALELKKSLEDVASRASKNASGNEQDVIITSKKEDSMEVMGYTQHTFMERYITSNGIKRLHATTGKVATKIQAPLLKRFLSTCKTILGKTISNLYYLDVLVDSDYNTGVAALAISGQLSMEDLALPTDEGGKVKSTVKQDAILTAFFPCRFLDDNSVCANPLTKIDILTKMSKGLKTKIRSISKVASEVTLSCRMESDGSPDNTYLDITVGAKQSDGAIIRSTIATVECGPNSGDEVILEKYDGKQVLLDSRMLDEAIGDAKGELSVGLSSSLLVFSGPDILVALSVKLTGEGPEQNTTPVAPRTPIPEATPLKPSATQTEPEAAEAAEPPQKAAKIKLSNLWITELEDKGDYLAQEFPELGLVIKIPKKAITTKSERKKQTLQENSLSERAFEILKTHANKPLSSTAILELLSDSEVKTGSLTAALSSLFKSGFIEKQKRGVFIYRDESVLDDSTQDSLEVAGLHTEETSIGESDDTELDEEEEKALLDLKSTEM